MLVQAAVANDGQIPYKLGDQADVNEVSELMLANGPLPS